MSIELYDHQRKAVNEMKNGSVLCGGVGSGKSLTALVYYVEKVCGGRCSMKDVNYQSMTKPRDLYIITTAKKRDSKEWEDECSKMVMNAYGVKVTVDSWNNIKKYGKVFSSFFIFDEQRVVGKGVWVKTFLDISRKNQWILLSATPADTYSDLIPIFIANGFYKNRTEFHTKHCVFKKFSTFPDIERYVGIKELDKHVNDVVIYMKDDRMTKRHVVPVVVAYDIDLYRKVMKDRWDPWENEPIAETGKLMYLLRKAANSNEDRINSLSKVIKHAKKVIVFYNFNYERDMIVRFCEENHIIYKQWNGTTHEIIPEGEEWVYLVQYAAGSEGWNCITTDTVVFFSQNYSYRITEQASGRIDRINSPYKDLFYYHFRSSAPIDIAIYRCLKDKKNFNEKNFLKTTQRSEKRVSFRNV